MLYLVEIEQKSQPASNGRKQYHVLRCEAEHENTLNKHWFWAKRKIDKPPYVNRFVIVANKPYRASNLINPTKALRYAMRVKAQQ